MITIQYDGLLYWCQALMILKKFIDKPDEYNVN